MTDVNEWLQLASTWQAQSVDLPTLQRSTRWHTIRQYGLLALEVASVLIIWCLAVYWQWFKPLPLLWQIWGWLWAVLAPLLTWLNVRARRGTWRVSENSLRGLLELKQRRAQSSLKMIAIGNLLIPYAIALAWLWNILAIVLYPPKQLGIGSFSGGILVTISLLAWLWLCARRARKDRHTIAETEAMLQDLR